VAGQTAPGEGVTVYGNRVSFSGANNIIVRYMRFRMGRGGDNDKDAAGLANGADMIFDHCSFSWGRDETFSINPDGKGTPPHNITLQNSIIGQGLMDHSAGGLMQADDISIIGNLLCDNSTRNFKVKGRNQYANNIVYNWKDAAYIMGGDSDGTFYVNIQSNLFINGPSGGGDAFTGANKDFHCYATDNWQDANRDGVFNPTQVSKYSAATVVSTPYDYPALNLNPGQSLLTTNLPTVGASLPYRDPADCYMIDEVMSYGLKGDLISNEASLACGIPTSWNLYAGTKKTDRDGDGMPDDWERSNGTNPNSNDAMTIAGNGYANIENYINSITASNRDFFLRVPAGLELEKATTQSLTVAWRDYTEGEAGFAIEIKTANSFQEVARTGANATSYTITGLQPGTKYTVRLRAFAGSQYSGYSSEAAMSTRPVETGPINPDTYVADYTWTGGSFDNSRATDANVLLAPASDGTLSLSAATMPTAIVYNAAANITVSGAGSFAGSTSLNKAGKGTLTLNNTNSYSGATVAHDGVVEFNSLKNGGQNSAIGSSVEFAQNWVFNGGTFRYTGGNTTTNRSAQLLKTSTFDIKSATVTMDGVVESNNAQADFVINGGGQLTVATTKFFGYTGATVLRGSTLYLSTTDITKKGIGSSSKLVLAGGHLRTKGETSAYEDYTFPIEVLAGTTSQFSPNRNCYFKSRITGSGTLQLNIPYLREYLQNNWSGFTGRVIANGVNSNNKEGSLFLIQGENNDLPDAAVTLKGNARACAWTTSGTFELGGLSGDKGTYLMGSSKQDKNFKCYWKVGSANTDEQFDGIINNWDCTGNDRGGTTNIEKVGTGSWRLTGANVYKGTTTVSGGTLIVDGSHTGTGLVTVRSGATLAGVGTLAGSAKLENGSTLQANSVVANGRSLTIKGTLTLNSGVTLKVADGTIGAKAGVSYKVFTAGSVSGTFKTIVPATPGSNLEWDTSELYTKGTLKVVAAAAPPVVLDELSVTAPTAASGVDVTVKRTLKAGEWSTIVLPFPMTNAMLKKAFGNDVQVADFTGYDVIDGHIQVHFKYATSVQMNRPYIIKVSKTVTQFGAEGVTISPIANPLTERGTAASPKQFVGTYVANTPLAYGMLYLSDNKFWYSGGQTTMKAFRAYFNFADKSIGMDATRVAITIDDDATSIDAINGLESSCEAVFSLQGQRVAAPVKGVYVRNGKKIVIK
jgi:autotransporter-associated beta strand protein